MTAERSIKIKFLGDTTDLNRAAKSSEQALGGWKNTFKGLTAAIGEMAIAEKVFEFLKDSVTAFSRAQLAQEKLNDAFTRFPKLADTSVEKLTELNEQLAAKTKFDHEAFASGEAILAQFNLTGKQVEDLTPLLADYAAKTGVDIPTAATTLGKAFLGNTRALKEIGISYKMTGDRAKDVANITQLVRDKVGGFATKEGKTASGQLSILGNKFEDVKETVGQKLLPVLTTLATVGLQVVDFITKNINVVGPLVAVIAAVVVVQWLWNAAMAANPIGLLIIGIAALVAGIVFLATKTKFFQILWSDALGLVKANWQEFSGLVVTGVKLLGDLFGAVGAGIVWPWKTAFNLIAMAWNNTVGRLDFTIPDWIPVIGGAHFSAPRIPTFHTGGVVSGTGERIIRVRGGEGVFTPDQMSAMGGAGGVEVHVYIGDTELTNIVDTQVRKSNRATKRGVLAGAGSR